MISLEGFSLPGSTTTGDAERKDHDKGQGTEEPANDWMSGFVGGLGITAKAEEDSKPVESKVDDGSAEPDLIKEITENIVNALGMGSSGEEETPAEGEENSWVPNLGFQIPDPFASAPDSDKDESPQAWPAFPNFWDQPEPSKSDPADDEKAEESNNTAEEDAQIILPTAEAKLSAPTEPNAEQDGFMTVPLVSEEVKPTCTTTDDPHVPTKPEEVETRKENGPSNEQGSTDDRKGTSVNESERETRSDEEKLDSQSVGGGMNPTAPNQIGEEPCTKDQEERENDGEQAIGKHSAAQTDPNTDAGEGTKGNDESSNDEDDPRQKLAKQPSFFATSVRSLKGATPNFFDSLFGGTPAETGTVADKSAAEAPNLFGSLFGGTPPETGEVPEDEKDVDEIGNDTVIHNSTETEPINTEGQRRSDDFDAKDEEAAAPGNDWLYSLQSFVSLQMAGVVDLVVTKPRHPKFHNRKAKAAASGGSWSFTGLSF